MSKSSPRTNTLDPIANGDRIGTLIFLALIVLVASAAIITSFSFPETALKTNVGPARFPDLFASVLIALCVIQGFLTFRTPVLSKGEAKAALEAPVPEGPESFGNAKPNYLRVFLGVVLMVLCIYAMSYAGFEVTASVFLFLLMRLMGRKNLLWNAIFAVALTAIIYVVFSIGLDVPLPEITLFGLDG